MLNKSIVKQTGIVPMVMVTVLSLVTSAASTLNIPTLFKWFGLENETNEIKMVIRSGFTASGYPWLITLINRTMEALCGVCMASWRTHSPNIRDEEAENARKPI